MTEGKRERGEAVKRKTARTSFYTSARFHASPSAGGWTLIELVITITVLTVLTLGIIPLVKTSVRRQKEARLRETLRQMRGAIDEFKRDTVGMQCGGLAGAGGAPSVVPAPPTPPGAPVAPGQVYIDPRSRVVISDCTIFGVDNPDRYPPSLQALVDGVKVIPRGGAGAGGIPNINTQPTDNAAATSTKLKVYLREIPVDPITGKAEWCVRSSYDTGDDCSSNPDNVFDVRSLAEGEALNGEKYRDW